MTNQFTSYNRVHRTLVINTRACHLHDHFHPAHSIATCYCYVILSASLNLQRRFPCRISVCIFVSLTCVTYLAGVSLSPDLTDSVLLNDLYDSQKYCSRVQGYLESPSSFCRDVEVLLLGGKISAEFINSWDEMCT
jgi:hypothetical protein